MCMEEESFVQTNYQSLEHMDNGIGDFGHRLILVHGQKVPNRANKIAVLRASLYHSEQREVYPGCGNKHDK